MESVLQVWRGNGTNAQAREQTIRVRPLRIVSMYSCTHHYTMRTLYWNFIHEWVGVGVILISSLYMRSQHMIRVSLCEPNPFQRASLQFLLHWLSVHVCMCVCGC